MKKLLIAGVFALVPIAACSLSGCGPSKEAVKQETPAERPPQPGTAGGGDGEEAGGGESAAGTMVQ